MTGMTGLMCLSYHSDDSDDGGLGEGPSLGPANQHAALAIKEESCDLDEEGLVTEGTTLNGTPSQGEGELRESSPGTFK